MKKYISIFNILFISINCHSQITDLDFSNDVKIDRVYFGLVSNSDINFTNSEMNNIASLQSGLMLTYSLNQKTKLRSFGVLKFENKEATQSFTSFEIIYNISKSIDWHLGTVSTPTTELRPNPTTWESQSETNAQSKIIGGRTGTKINFKLSPNLKMSYGLFNHNGTWANHLKFEYKLIKVAGFIEKSKTFLVFDINTNSISSIITLEPKNQFSKSVFIHFYKSFSLLIESEYSIKKERVDYANIGLRKYFSSSNNKLKGFFSFGYNLIESNQITGSFAIHL